MIGLQRSCPISFKPARSSIRPARLPRTAMLKSSALAQQTWPEDLQRRYRVVDVIGQEMADVLAAATLVVSRSGAGTVTEIASYGPPAILIPLPGAGGDEQTRNARVLSDIDAAVLIPQSEATPERLDWEIRALLADAPNGEPE